MHIHQAELGSGTRALVTDKHLVTITRTCPPLRLSPVLWRKSVPYGHFQSALVLVRLPSGHSFTFLLTLPFPSFLPALYHLSLPFNHPSFLPSFTSFLFLLSSPSHRVSLPLSRVMTLGGRRTHSEGRPRPDLLLHTL